MKSEGTKRRSLWNWRARLIKRIESARNKLSRRLILGVKLAWSSWGTQGKKGLQSSKSGREFFFLSVGVFGCFLEHSPPLSSIFRL
jgi:hypothetical protein